MSQQRDAAAALRPQRSVGGAEVAFGPPEILPRTDLVDFRLEFCLLAERHTEHVAAAEPQLLAFRPGRIE